MDIPQSVIEPFEPLGIPKLGVMKYESITAALDRAFEIMNNHNGVLPLGVDAIKLFLQGMLVDCDATLDDINVTGWDGDLVVVDLTYSADRGPVRYVNHVESDVGFGRPSRVADLII